MNNLVYICNEIINSIPMEILQEAFNLDTPSDMVRATSLEDKIIVALLFSYVNSFTVFAG